MRVQPSHLGLLALCALLPFASDAGAGQAKCCNLAASYKSDLFPGGQGDEDFFTVPGGPPSVMILLDNSISMLDFPRPLLYPDTLEANQGVCDITSYDGASSLRATAGLKTYEQRINITDGTSVAAPPWVTTGTGGCLSGGAGKCLFKPTAYYRYQPQNGYATTDWDADEATERTAAEACTGLTDTSACQTCLTTKGYYLYKDAWGTRRAAFAGSFLNVFPPKFIYARKVLRDLLSIDPATPSSVDYVRFGLATFGTTVSGTGHLVRPVSPAICEKASPEVAEATRRSDFISARNTLLSDIDAVGFVTFTPLAHALLKVGQYFSDGDEDGTGSQWATWFPGWWDSAFWNGKGPTASDTTTNSVCWSCQTSSVLVVTDGQPREDDGMPDTAWTEAHLLPKEGTTTGSGNYTTDTGTTGKVDFYHWEAVSGTSPTVGLDRQPIACPGCGVDDGHPSVKNVLHLVAAFLRNTDLRDDFDGKQILTTYTISVGLDPTTDGYTLLQKTADLGGGFYTNTSDADELSSALYTAVTDVVTKATSFSVSNTNALQASTAAQLFTARFRPVERLNWEGHLYRFTLFNELALGCDPTKATSAQTLIPTTAATCGGKNPNIDGRETSGSLADCTGYYLVDSECSPVVEDPVTGAFKQGHFASGVLVADSTDAKPFWDAGRALSDSAYRPPSSPTATPYRSADEDDTSKRTIYTLVDNDTNEDGQFTKADSLVEFTAANVGTIAPYLELDSKWCGSLFDSLGFTKPSTWAAADYQKCALQVIHYVRGWDVMDEDDDGCAGPGGLGSTSAQSPKACTTNADCSPSTTGACSGGKCTPCASGSKGEQRDVANGHWKLGDIFHSSPQVVEPPYNETVCDLARGQTQCVATIHSPAALTHETQTAIEVTSGVDAYDQWRAAGARDRKRIVLAGANDGMLHAFDAGDPDTSATRDAFGSLPYKFGTGEELWAFIPPDLLPKLKYMLKPAPGTSPTHQYYVDGNIMVRDIWVDGGASGTVAKDQKKQKEEFHTIAVFSERSGGVQNVALDVTDPVSPKFLWSFPPLCSLEQNLVGQSWSDFSPRPPPIGPVKLALSSGTDSLGRSFEERWIVMINGGYDPGAQKGRGVWMLDAWTGGIVWQFTDPDFQGMFTSGTSSGMFPVAASVGMQDIGDADQATLDSDGYFDTATWGDMGGQLWVARFKEPGDISTGKVTNWFAARAFEELRQSDDSQTFSATLADGTVQHRSEFYRMTSNVWDPATSSLRSFLGSGNREKLLEVGPTCGAGNLIGCFQAGCNVIKLKSTLEIGSCKIETFVQANNENKMEHNQVTYTGCGSTPLDCSSINEKIDLNLNKCGSTDSSITNFQGTLIDCDCDTSGDCSCSSHLKMDERKNVSTKGWSYTSHNRFYGAWAYDSSRPITSAATAVTFDKNRASDVAVTTCPSGSTCPTLVNVTAASVDEDGVVTCDTTVVTNSTSTACQATTSDRGWFYEYGRKCPLASCSPDPPWTDEKTGSAATVLGRCVDWNTLRPMGAAVSSAPCTYGSGSPRNYTYLADIISGVPTSSACGFQASATDPIVRASSRTSIAPPLDPTSIVTVSATGVVRQSVLQIEPGSLTSKDVVQRNDISQPIYWLEVPRDLHQCRHVDSSVCR